MRYQIIIFIIFFLFVFIYYIFIKHGTFKFINIFPAIILMCLSILWHIRWEYNKNKFIDNAIYSKAISSYGLGNGIVEFKLDSNYTVEFSPDRFFILVGDSIAKSENSSIFNVYRKESGKYVFFKEYDYEQ